MKRLFVSDLDGTLLNEKAQVSEYTKKVVNQGMEKGLQFTISTVPL